MRAGVPPGWRTALGTTRLVHHPTGRVEHRDVDWVVAVVPPEPDDGLWTALCATAPAPSTGSATASPRAACTPR